MGTVNSHNSNQMHHDETLSYESDTVIVAASSESFSQIFIGERSWYPIRLDVRRLHSLKWIAVYQTRPISAITFLARIVRIEKYLETGRYRLALDGLERLGFPISFVDLKTKSMQGQRYSRVAKILQAKSIDDLQPWG